MRTITAVHFRGVCGSHCAYLVDRKVTADDPLIIQLRKDSEDNEVNQFQCRNCPKGDLAIKIEHIETDDPIENHWIDTTDSHPVIMNENWVSIWRNDNDQTML